MSDAPQPTQPDHDAVRDDWERIRANTVAMTWAPPRTAEPFTREHLLSLMTRAPRAFWRFDVDFSLDAAVRMAEFAQTAGVSGTFYVMATGSFYNPFSLAGRAAVRRIADHGHRVGVHADERSAGVPVVGEPMPAWSAAMRAGELLDAMMPGVVERSLVSFHMPSENVLWRDLLGLESAYAARWKGHYVSDSRREWDADKEARLVKDAGEGTQVCLHSEHWFG